MLCNSLKSPVTEIYSDIAKLIDIELKGDHRRVQETIDGVKRDIDNIKKKINNLPNFKGLSEAKTKLQKRLVSTISDSIEDKQSKSPFWVGCGGLCSTVFPCSSVHVLV